MPSSFASFTSHSAQRQGHQAIALKQTGRNAEKSAGRVLHGSAGAARAYANGLRCAPPPLPTRRETGGVPSLRPFGGPAHALRPRSLSPQGSPLAVVQSCHSTPAGPAARQAGPPDQAALDRITPTGKRSWHLLEGSWLPPAMEQFLVRVGEIDAAIEACSGSSSEISSGKPEARW